MSNMEVSRNIGSELQIDGGLSSPVTPVSPVPSAPSKPDIMKIIVASLMVVTSIVLISLVAVNARYQKRLQLATTVNGIAMSNMTPEEAYQTLAAGMNDYRLEVVGKDGSAVYLTPEDAGLSISHEKASEAFSLIITNQSLTNLLKQKDYEIGDLVAVDKEKLLLYIQGLDLFNPREAMPSENAYMEFDEGLSEYVIREDRLGNQLTDEVVDVLEQALLNREPVLDLLEAGLYIGPQITKDNEILNHNVLLYNDYLPGDYTIDMVGATEQLSKNQYRDWLVPNYMGETEGEDSEVLRKLDPEEPFTIDEEKLDAYMDGLYKEYNTMGMSREFVTNYGSTIKLTPGNYGWWLNYDKTMGRIQEALLSKNTVEEIQAEYRQQAVAHGKKDYGNSYVEIDLKAQRLWLYSNGGLVLSSDVVTGKPSAGYTTPPGIYAVTYKQRNATLNGPGYSTPVDYWMPFNKNIGLHDATWQPSFGGDRYLTHGSHGCVNLPYEVAKKIYSYVEKEFPIILY